MQALVGALKAAGEPTRLRILALLAHHELTVSELVAILGQSQPRVSRHLRVLGDAGLVHRHAEGTSALFRLERSGELGRLVRAILDTVEADDPDVRRDRGRLEEIRADRRRQSEDYFRRHAAEWDLISDHHPADAAIERALVDLVTGLGRIDLLDLGTGTGRVLELTGPQIRRGLGIDRSRDMLAIARDRLERRSLHNCEVRLGDIAALDLPDGVVDVVVLHHVVHFLDDPDRALAEAARVLRPGGTLAIVDFVPHSRTELAAAHAHRRLGVSTAEIVSWAEPAGFGTTREVVFPSHGGPDADELAVALWIARLTPPEPEHAPAQRRTDPRRAALEVAS
ncbi:MAG: ArsR/SmtB family transcription factor [Acidimicrobiales bacterium]